MIPTTMFLGREVSRLTVGDNPTNGHSYIPDNVTREEMLSYYTEENLISQLFEAEKQGYTVWQPLASEFSMRALLHYRERGGKLDVIFQSHVPVDFEINVRQMLAFRPLAIYVQGTSADGLFEQGKKDTVRDRVKHIQSLGVKAGFATHVPEHLVTAEEEGWGADFYMACLHNTRKTAREASSTVTGKTRKEVLFAMSDRAEMLRVIAAAPTPVIAYKIFAGGQIFYGKEPSEYRAAAEEAMREVFDAIKPGDIATVGIFQRDKNQLRENAEIAAKVFN